MTENARSHDRTPPPEPLDGRGGREARRRGSPVARRRCSTPTRPAPPRATCGRPRPPTVRRPMQRVPGTQVRRALSDVSPEVYRAPGRCRVLVGCSSPRARRPPPMILTVGVDVGGTKVAGGVVDNGTILAQHRVHARHATRATTSAITAVIETLRRVREVEAVGIGIAGFVDAARSTVYFAPNLLAGAPGAGGRAAGGPARRRGERRERRRRVRRASAPAARSGSSSASPSAPVSAAARCRPRPPALPRLRRAARDRSHPDGGGH